MLLGIRHALINLGLGVLAGGLLASLVLAGVPSSWRGPALPAMACALAVGAVTALRWRTGPGRAGRGSSGDHD